MRWVLALLLTLVPVCADAVQVALVQQGSNSTTGSATNTVSGLAATSASDTLIAIFETENNATTPAGWSLKGSRACDGQLSPGPVVAAYTRAGNGATSYSFTAPTNTSVLWIGEYSNSTAINTSVACNNFPNITGVNLTWGTPSLTICGAATALDGSANSLTGVFGSPPTYTSGVVLNTWAAVGYTSAVTIGQNKCNGQYTLTGVSAIDDAWLIVQVQGVDNQHPQVISQRSFWADLKLTPGQLF